MPFDRNRIRLSILARIPELDALDFEEDNDFIFLREFSQHLLSLNADSRAFSGMIKIVNEMSASKDPMIQNFAQLGIFEHLAENPKKLESIRSKLNAEALCLLENTLRYFS